MSSTQLLDCHFGEQMDNLLSLHEIDDSDRIQQVLYAITGTDNVQLINATCRQCGKPGHFCRDCPDLGGTGNSTVGARHGTAEGFKPNDDPMKRPLAYRQARAASIAKRQAMAANRQRIQSRSKPSSAPASGKLATHARRMRTSKATSPTPRHYQMYLNALLSAVEAALSDIKAAPNVELFNHLEGLATDHTTSGAAWGQ